MRSGTTSSERDYMAKRHSSLLTLRYNVIPDAREGELADLTLDGLQKEMLDLEICALKVVRFWLTSNLRKARNKQIMLAKMA